MSSDHGLHAPQTFEATLQGWYTRIERHDLDAVADALTDDFLLVETSELMDKAALMARLRLGAERGVQTAELSEFHTVVAGDIAWTTLRNREVWTPYDSTRQTVRLEFLETVVGRLQAGQWRLHRYHANLLRQDGQFGAPVTG